jgi:hypothetical protein
MNNYRGDDWGNNGPGVITRILKNRCYTTTPVKMSAATCKGKRYYPIIAAVGDFRVKLVLPILYRREL